MKIVSHKPAHQHAINTVGSVTVNGIVFRAGDQGKPTAYGVTERQLALFSATDGFSFFHDDGTYSGPSGQASTLRTGPSAIEVATQRLDAASDEAKAHAQIEQWLREGNVPQSVMDKLMQLAPTVGATSATGVGNEAVSMTTPDLPEVERYEAEDDEEGDEDKAEQASDPVAPSTEPEGTEYPDSTDSEEVDMADPESIAKLPRTELFGLAKSFGVEFKANQSSLAIATAIADVVKASPEYKQAVAEAEANES